MTLRSDQMPVEPFTVAQEVELYVRAELRDTEKYSNRDLLDESGVYDLHSLAALIYQMGFNDGRAVEGWKRNEHRQRARDVARKVGETDA